MPNKKQSWTLILLYGAVISLALVFLLDSCSHSVEVQTELTATTFTSIVPTSTKLVISPSVQPPTFTNLPSTETEISRIATFGRMDGNVQNVVISDNGKILAAAGGKNDQIIVWDIDSGKALLSLKENNDPNIALTADGRLLASTTWGDNWITIRDTQTGQTLHKIKAEGNVHGFTFSPDGNVLALGGEDAIWLWDIHDNTLLDYLGPQSRSISALAFSRDGKQLVSVGDSAIQLWDLESRKALQTISLSKYQLYQGASISPGNPDYVAIPYWSRVDPDSPAYLDKNSVEVWDTKNGENIRTITGFGASGSPSSVSPDGKFLAVTQSTSNQIWDVSSGKAVYKFPNLWAVFAFSADGNHLAVGHLDGTVELWDISQLK